MGRTTGPVDALDRRPRRPPPLGRVPAIFALLVATTVWGSTFVVTKQSLGTMSPASFLVWRFGLAAVVLALARPAAVARLGAADRARAGALGVALGAGFLLQTAGLQHTLAGVSGFLTGASVVLTPIVAALAFRAEIGGRGWAAVAVAAVGLGLLAGGVSQSSVLGSILTLAGALGFALHITGLSQWATPENAVGVTTASVAVAAALCALVAVPTGGIDAPPDASSWRAIAYLALAATCAGFVIQAWAQSALSASTAAVVMTMEPLFAALLATAAGERGLEVAGWAGGVLIVAAMFLAEFGPRRCCDALSPRVECC